MNIYLNLFYESFISDKHMKTPQIYKKSCACMLFCRLVQYVNFQLIVLKNISITHVIALYQFLLLSYTTGMQHN